VKPAIHREFLGWQGPALAAAGDYLARRFAHQSELDLGGVIIVVPGGRASRRLLEILVDLAAQRGLVLTPPEIVTEHELPEKLYLPKRPFADSLTQQLAWAAALQSLPPKQLAPYLPHPPAAGDTPRWLAVGEVLRRLHLELAADGIDCRKVLAGADAVEGFAEHARWEALCLIQRAYLDQLDALDLWDKQTARLVAIEHREINTEKQVVLLGTVDLNRAQRQILDQIAPRVTALVVAPAVLAARFDAYGCLIPSQWTEIELPLADEQIERVDGPADQAEAVWRWLAGLNGRHRADEIVVGMPDERLAPQLERQLAQAGVATRQAIGKKLPETGPYRLLRIAADYAARGRFRDLAALVRHPDVFEWLAARLAEFGIPSASILLELDRYAADRLPARLEESRLESDSKCANLLAIHKRCHEIVAPLLTAPQKLAAWAAGLRSVLLTVYGQRTLEKEPDRFLLGSLAALNEAFDQMAAAPGALQPVLDAAEACRLALDGLADSPIAPPADPNAVELLGWLELPLDDAPALIVTTFNEGFVPSSMSADAFLPNALRQHLGLVDNDRRLARDAYSLSVLLASREQLKLVVAHRDAEGNPLAPSRLLFATDADRVVARARTFFSDLPPAAPRRNLLAAAAPPRRQSDLVPPKPQPLAEPLTALGVTQFRDYIACPYRFYLRNVVKLQPLSDQADELDGGAFGNLVHGVLERFGRSEEAEPLRRATEAELIARFLEERLDRVAAARFGKTARAAVRVQLEQARLRLVAFAQWQARRTAEGWRIVFSEDTERSKESLEAPFDVSGRPFTLRGRIDRIDYHDKLRILAVLDYKTADAGLGPERVHRRGEEWIDLQLPLYRHLLRAAGLAVDLDDLAKIELGYILLPKDSAGVKHAPADWDEALLQSADERARQIIADILAERFWPPIMPPPAFCEDLAAICQDHRLGSWLACEEAGE
jgi:ATP-dependent helicase/nuclease subunit B